MADLTHIGFLGLGQMGAPMAERLLAPGIRLHVFDPREAAMAPFVARGAQAHASPKSVADAAGIVFACLPSGMVSEAAALGPDGVFHGAAIRIHAEMSTIGRPVVQRIAAGLAPRGIALVDAPISGGPAGARAGTLAMLAAGAPAAVAALRPYLERIGSRVFVLGEQPGQGQVMKLVNNLIFAANAVAAFEGFALGAKAGLDPDTMVAMVNAGTGRNFATEAIMPKVLSGAFGFGAAIAVVDKDVTLGLEEGRAQDVPMWAIEQAARVWRFAAGQGHGGEDIAELARIMEGWAGAQIRSRA
ncbi:NAD(P)-dependent oxidoreductase [Paracraurococcus ruber]|uniref:3-hydroxyisobutyrate dehydrogenase n=1 Tax=Paracraurococcus ruber TaxID=77675 RepID=A0ABS1CUZ2_9PROT|nr:NAD(P)-dependent oxidoreductase [Paracraurococcus ruber]MBK1658335.1 3-hydroxyisobutyrate dehydrogenase [Paracraurococcus ruber]TDG29918.1 NAD(P)-dependent oxidoreductase [Paracraurococcus ruber]